MRGILGKRGDKRISTEGTLGCAFGLLVVCFAAIPAQAHTSLPGYLALQETNRGSFDLVWKVPTAEGPPPAIFPVFQPSCTISKPLTTEQTAGAILERGSIQCGPAGLNGTAISISGLNVTILDVLVRIAFADGSSVQHMLKPLETSFIVHKDGKNRIDTWGYFTLG
ncbi:MAG TPA: hypothetical protein VIH58_13715, partial [Chthoniobacterales bacterium]